ncbi:RES family NAD+ phosphorylase [Xanthomonas campestris pv. incanae]|uniref:RES family NAD+ phosphorylase n=1 Tax=Xanthomonas campestris TaxID=339 RepID=UPI003F4CE032
MNILLPGSALYRCRVAKSELERQEFRRNPEKELGAAPRQRAANNRMSAAGVPVFYASGEIETCIAEVRPSIGDTIIAGKFKATRPLRLFDFTRLGYNLRHQPLSLLDPLHERRTLDRILLTYLHEEIAHPVRANDSDYVVTQALAEFIRYGRSENFDGVAFQSVQRKGGLNYAIFNEDQASGRLASDHRSVFPASTSVDDVTEYVIDGVIYATGAVPAQRIW